MYRRKLPFLLLICFSVTISSCKLFKNITTPKGEEEESITSVGDSKFVGVESVFDIQFVQNGREAYIEEGIVKLRKEPFSINLVMQNVDGVFVNSSLAYAQRFEEDNAFDDLETIYQKVMAEPAFNKDRELYVSNDNYSFWFYDENLDWHRLNDVRVEGKKVVGEKSIENLVFPEQNRTIVVQSVPQDMFLFFFALDDKLDEGFQIRQRQYIKVEWN